MVQKIIKYCLIVLLLETLSVSSFSQCNSELANYAVGFDKIEASSFSFFENSLENVRLIGLGEDTHGTAEFTLLAEELMKYLADKQGFQALIIETGFGEGQYLNDYIQGKRDDLAGILSKHNSTWRYSTKEFHHFMNWLRKHNEAHANKIRLYGCEMQYVISDVNRIRDYLKTVGSDYQIDGFEKHLWQPISDGEKTDYYISYIKLKQYFANNYETFKSKTSEEEFNLCYRHIMVLGQFVLAVNQNSEQRKHDLRDLYMAENIQWILSLNDSKALYWAHNAHVGDWIDNGIVDVAGHQLKKIYGDAYFNIATDFGTGDFFAFSQKMKMEVYEHKEVLEGTFSSCLKSLGKPNTFLNIRKAKENEKLSAYLNSELTTMSGAGAQVRSSKVEVKEIGRAFDGIIYLDKTNKLNWFK